MIKKFLSSKLFNINLFNVKSEKTLKRYEKIILDVVNYGLTYLLLLVLFSLIILILFIIIKGLFIILFW